MTTAAARPWWIDGVRARIYRSLKPWLGRLYADRSRRVLWLGLASVALSFALTVVAPLWLLAWGPLVLGVPHLLADVRYLVVQPKLHRRGPLAWAALVPLIATVFGAPAAVTLLVMIPAIAVAEASRVEKAFALGVWALLTVAAVVQESTFVLAFVHLHNLVALGLWWWWRPRVGGAWLVPLAVAVGTLVLLLGGADGVVTAFDGWKAFGTMSTLDDWSSSHAPFAGTASAPRWILSFAFLQSIHYALWLRLIPEDARERPAPRPFRETWRRLRADLGLPTLALFAVMGLGLALWGLVDAAGARWGYLQLAGFHGFLELAVISVFVLEGRRPC